MKLTLSRMPSPLGDMLLATDADACIHALEFGHQQARLQRRLRMRHADLVPGPSPASIAGAVARYFEGDLTAIEAIATIIDGSELERRVWAALRRIPPGRTMSYGTLARSLGYADPRMAIDIGMANSANPIALVVPCHRVVGSKGELKGYAWGLERKRWLLAHEGAALPGLEAAGAESMPLPGF